MTMADIGQAELHSQSYIGRHTAQAECPACRRTPPGKATMHGIRDTLADEAEQIYTDQLKGMYAELFHVCKFQAKSARVLMLWAVCHSYGNLLYKG